MRIEKAIIYGFGKHEDRTIEFNDQATIFHGPNEAGKTTIQQFIIQTLFGYPARNLSLQRYEPKSGGKYGGQLHINDQVYGKVIIERVKGKSAGDVTVFFEDGRRGSEEQLKLLLRNYDRSSFEAVFSFSIHELQGLEKMTEEELSRTLLASGTTGIDTIAKMETRLEKEMAGLFKKGGRNPDMNILIEELKEIDREIKDYRARIEQYEPSVRRVKEIEQRLEKVSREEKRVSDELKQAEKWFQAAPLIERKKNLDEKIAGLPNRDFPADGSRRMDRIIDRISETRAQLEHVEQEMASLNADSFVSPELDQIEHLLNQESEWHQLRALLRQKTEEAEQLADDQERLMALVGMEEQEILKSDVSLNKEEQLVEFIQKADVEEENRRYHQRKLAEEQEKANELEKEWNAFLQHQPSAGERAGAQKWSSAKVQLAEARAAKRIQGPIKNPGANYLLIVLGALGLVYGILQTNYPVAVIALLVAVAGVWQVVKSGKNLPSTDGYEEVLKEYEGRESEFETLVRRLDIYDRKAEDMKRDLEAAKKRVAQLSSDPEKLSAKQAYEQFLAEMGIDPSSNRSVVLDLFEKLREIQAIHSRRQRVKEETAGATAQLNKWLLKAEQATGKTVDADGLYAMLRSEYHARQQRLSAHQQQLEKLEELENQQKQLETLSDQLEKDRRHLLTEAGVEETEDFYRAWEANMKRKELVQERSPVDAQLETLGKVEKPLSFDDSSAADYIADQEGLLANLAEERKELLAEQADRQQSINALLSDQAYEEKLQQFEEKKAELAGLAKRWSVDKAITEAIRQTMEELKEKKLPAVIAIAQQYFNKLTEGAYEQLEINPDGYFEAIAPEGLRFHIAELSQATKEQAYVALRLALVQSMRESHPFPVIMDDAFVHFDRSRLQQMINLLTELQQQHQFIYFTCHDTMQQIWPNAGVIEVATNERGIHT
ncbi:ATP-binding protein [Planococcus salinus]|uniref:YhaN AAA domain-containing protein n=1 Tax=Planococcus salinus TaxID=1848460 RepID=A0A3M8P6W6_9BACL|nr:AAA family ATPase [Planococcus salinus]RNF39417.1 hypothetical protein EEX84_10055 [Planococcus salinus]